MHNIVAWAGKNRLLALLLTTAVIMAGAWSAANLPIDAVPDVTNTQVQVVTRAPSLSALEVETQVTQPIERGMAGTPRLKLTRSITKLGISIVTLIFEEGTDIYFARTQVAERLVSIRERIPAAVGRPELGPISTALGEIYMFELRSTDDRHSGEELRTMVEWQIAPRLRQVGGVIEVLGFGGSVKQYRVTLDPARLAAHALSIEEVRSALEKDNLVEGGGYTEHAGEQIVLRGDARFRGIEDIRAAVVRVDKQGSAIRVGQLGEVDTGPALRQGAMTRDGRGEIVGASVLMLKGENSREVVDAVERAIADLRAYLPRGVAIDPYYDRSEFIEGVLATIGKNLAEGAVIVILCLLLTLGSVRAGLLVAGAIPFSMLVGFVGLSAIGYSGNVMSLGAIDFGIIVEGAVLTVEHAMTHGASVADRAQRRERILHAIKQVARPALFVVFITLLVFLPLATLEDVEGKMFRPVVYSLSFMLLGAIFYALVVIPAVAPTVLPGNANAKHREPLFARLARRAYAPALDWALARPRLTIVGSLLLTVSLLASGVTLGADFLPRVFEGSYAIDAMRPPSTSLTQAIDLARETEIALKEVPEVLTVVNRIGRPEGGVDPSGPEASDVFVILKPRGEWRRGVTPEALMTELSDKCNARVPATINAFSQPIEMRVNDLIAGVRSDIAVKVFGDDLATISDVSERIRQALARVPGAADVKREIPTGQPAVRVTVDRERIARLGIPPREVLSVLAMSRAGVPVGVVREGERVFDLLLRVGGDQVTNASDLGRLPVLTRNGNIVPINMTADIDHDRTVVQVSREQLRRRLVVQANVRGRDMVGFVHDAQREVAALHLPPSVEIVWGGQFQNFTRAKDRLILLVPVALVVIALMLMVTFGKARYVLVTILILPLAAAGGVLGLVVRGLPFSIPAGVGFIALAGVSVCTGIVMTSNLLAQPRENAAVARVREAALASLRARISTALIAAIGFVPAALATGTGAEVQRPLATVVIFGLLVSMVLSLLALPALLLLAVRGERPSEVEPETRVAEV
jgi:cobalt-zinc-cadmium resistance protein CzcA